MGLLLWRLTRSVSKTVRPVNGIRVLVFCKAPIPGQVMRRLLPVLNESEAASFHSELALAKIELCIESGLAPTELWCFPNCESDFFNQFEGAVQLHPQQGQDLGERMANAFHNSAPAILIGTDCPEIDSAYLILAVTQLMMHDAVVAPAEDGGYGLIGLRKPDDGLFADINWGSDTVYADTCRRLDERNLNWVALPEVWDVDRPEDLARYRRWKCTGSNHDN